LDHFFFLALPPPPSFFLGVFEGVLASFLGSLRRRREEVARGRMLWTNFKKNRITGTR